MITGLLAPNPGPMTLQGTNTWLVAGDDGLVVVDPGPDDPAHLTAILAAVDRPVAIVVTHRHLDHVAACGRLAERWGCAVHAADPAWCRDADPLSDGDRIGPLQVISTPGHTDDSISLLADHDHQLLTGDTVLGGSSTVITHPDGDVGAHLDSLERLIMVCRDHAVRRLLPGHGPVIDDPVAALEDRRAHRLDRLDQVRSALGGGAGTVAEVTARVHAGLDPRLLPAAHQSIAAQLAHLDALAAEDPFLRTDR